MSCRDLIKKKRIVIINVSKNLQMHILLLDSCQAWGAAPPAGASVQSAVFSAQNESEEDFCILRKCGICRFWLILTQIS